MAIYHTFAETLEQNPTQIIEYLNDAFSDAGIDLVAEYQHGGLIGVWDFYREIDGTLTDVLQFNYDYPTRVLVNNEFTVIGSSSNFGIGTSNYIGICKTTHAVALTFGSSLSTMNHYYIFGQNENHEPCLVLSSVSNSTSIPVYPQFYDTHVKVLDKNTAILALRSETVFLNNVFSAFEIPAYVGTRVKNVYRCSSGLAYYYDATIGKVGERDAALICGCYVLLDEV